jgi:hypothetical protein
VAPTNISAAIVGGKTWQSGLNFKRKPRGKFSRLDFIIIDEASMIQLKDFQKILAYYPCTDIICLGDPMQLRFNDNIFERFNGWTHELYLKNEKNPRIRDSLLLKFVNDLRFGKIDLDFIKSRCVHNTAAPVLSFKNYDCDVYNRSYTLGEAGTIVKSTFNEKIGTHQFYNNELHKVIAVNEWTITLQSLDTKTEKIIPTMFFNGSHTLPSLKEKPYFEKAQMMTAFSIQGKTMDKIAIDLGSFVCNSKKGPVVHLDTLYRGIIVGASRVKTADDVFFLNYDKLGDKSIRFADDFIPHSKEWDECMDVNEVVANSINKEQFLKNLPFLATPIRSLKGEKTVDKIESLGALAPSKIGSPDHKEEQEFVEMVMDEYDHSKGHRQIFMSSLTGRLNKKKNRDESKGYPFDTRWAFQYAQSLVGLEDNKYKDLCKRL